MQKEITYTTSHLWLYLAHIHNIYKTFHCQPCTSSNRTLMLVCLVPVLDFSAAAAVQVELSQVFFLFLFKKRSFPALLWPVIGTSATLMCQPYWHHHHSQLIGHCSQMLGQKQLEGSCAIPLTSTLTHRSLPERWCQWHGTWPLEPLIGYSSYMLFAVSGSKQTPRDTASSVSARTAVSAKVNMYFLF